ncbi:MAG: sulfide/dihydroorotate dehydrogenase-like FAD/NAD-binding protein [Vicinamibacterales bacterium]|nr:sulfide/dihydroorotate dehydrogenase-like FAD/NAD-binding protein [Vicinamibacterales bacterium]
MHRILSKEVLAPEVVRFWVEAPHVARKRKPGQFVIVRGSEEGERIPLTIADVDRQRGAISLVIQGVGKSTRQLNSLNEGDSILDLAGPLGRATELHPGRKVCCIGGGIGTAVVYPIASGFKALQGEVTVIIGGRNKEFVILEPELRAVADRVIVTTDDGSYGTQGLVTDALKGLLAEGLAFDEVVAVGPLPMMKAVVDVTRPLHIPTTVSLNPVMVDGTGMCGGCRVSVGGEQKFVCVDGPEFDGLQVDFDELNARLRAYREQEQEALRLYNDKIACRAV